MIHAPSPGDILPLRSLQVERGAIKVTFTFGLFLVPLNIHPGTTVATKQKFDLHLPGLLKVLAEHLYSSKKVGIRELLQNAHDSCVRRKLEGDDADYWPRIDLAIDPKKRIVTIRDNGCGLTAEEITHYLATIGRGYTRELREKLSLCSAAEAAQLIGQFGLGFLSAFLLADQVTLITRSFQGGEPLQWRSSGDEYYDVTPYPDAEIGTTVELHIKPAASFMLQEQALTDTVRTYADFLPVPIYLEGDPEPLNSMTPPWEADDPEAALPDYLDRVFHTPEPLFVLPLRDWKVDVGHDKITVPLRGVLFVPPGSVASVREYGDVTVYIRRMFICDRQRDLLPPWARFVRGAIDCPALQPTASREDIHQDENFESVQQALEEQLGRGLQLLAREEPATWKKLIQGHSDVIMGWAARDREFFDRVDDLILFRTSRGLMSLPEYLRQSGGTLYYVTREMGSLQEQLLAEGRDVPAIDASWFAVSPFLQQYAAKHQDVGLVQLDGSSEELLRPVPVGPFAKLLDLLHEDGVKARVASFKPIEVPGLMVYPEGAEIGREAREAMEKDELPGPIAGLVGEYVERRFQPDDLQGTLILNASCPLVRRLAEASCPPAIRAALLTVMHQMARLFCGRMLSAAEAAQAFGDMTKAMGKLVKP
jgi:molecular chaperone HtpG